MSKWNRMNPPSCPPPAPNLWTNLSSFGKIWEFGIQHFPSFPQECRARDLGVGRSLRSQAMGRFSGQNFSKFVWRIVANSYQGMVKGSLWGSAWVENVRNPNIEQQNSSLWSLGCWFWDGKVQPSFRHHFWECLAPLYTLPTLGFIMFPRLRCIPKVQDPKWRAIQLSIFPKQVSKD